VHLDDESSARDGKIGFRLSVLVHCDDVTVRWHEEWLMHAILVRGKMVTEAVWRVDMVVKYVVHVMLHAVLGRQRVHRGNVDIICNVGMNQNKK
jgi:hypothetical protein